MTTTTELTPLLKRLKLGAVLNTLPERVALARREQLDYASFLQIILTDEVNRRDHRRLELRLQRAGFEQTSVFVSFPPSRPYRVTICGTHSRPPDGNALGSTALKCFGIMSSRDATPPLSAAALPRCPMCGARRPSASARRQVV